MARQLPPYRAPSPSPTLPSLRLHYLPFFGLWPFLLTVLVALPLAYWARHDAHSASVVSCATFRLQKGQRTCYALDARTSQAMSAVDCRETPEILERVTDRKNPFSWPVVTAMEVAVPQVGVVATRNGDKDCTSHGATGTSTNGNVVIGSNVIINGQPYVPPAAPATAHFGAYEGDGISVAEAEAKVKACAFEPDSSGLPRTLNVVVMGRNYLGSVLVLLGCLALGTCVMLRRRTRLSLDGERRFLRIEEYGLLLRTRVTTIETARIEWVDVVAGLAGPIYGRRVELRIRGGARMPLLDRFAPLTSTVHERTARKLREGLFPALASVGTSWPAAAPVRRRTWSAAAALGAAFGLAALATGVGVFYLRAHRPATSESSGSRVLEGFGATRKGSTVLLARLGETRLAIVSDKEAHAVRAVEAPTLMAHLGGPVNDRLDGKLTSPPGPMVLADDGRLYVTLPQESAVVVFEVSPLGKSLQITGRLTTESEPVDLALTPDGHSLVVLSDYGHALQSFDLNRAQGQLQPELRVSTNLPRSPRALALSADGQTAYVTHDAASALSIVDLESGKLSAQSLSIAQQMPETRHVERKLSEDGKHLLSTRTYMASDTVVRPTTQALPVRMADHLFLPSVLVSTGDPLKPPPRSYYGSSDAPVERFWLQERDADGTDVRTVDPSFMQPLGCLLPESTALDEKNQWLYLACDGPGHVYKIDLGPERRCADGGAWNAGFKVGDDPTGMAIDRDDHVLVVWSQATQTLTTLPLDADVPLGIAGYTPAFGSEYEPASEWVHPLVPSVRDAQGSVVARGRELFYATNDREVSASGVACASCHIGGRDDGLTWPTAAGPRQTPMLGGRLNRTAPYGWAGQQADLRSYIESTFARLGGKSLRAADEDALVAYMRSIPGPHFAVKDAASAARGKEIFASAEAGCAGCHSTGQGVFTDTERHDVKSRLDVDTPADFDTPSLLYVGSSGPYFHDGRYASLGDLLKGVDGTMGHTKQLDDGQRADLLTYLASIGGS